MTYGGSSAGTYLGFDAVGKPVRGLQQIGGINYQTSAIYNLAGAVTGMTYPSGRTVAYGYDSAGRTSSFTGYLGDGNYRVYSTGMSYSPLGGLSQEQFGTNVPIYNKLFYNSRGQLAEIRAGLTPNDTSWQRGAIINFYSTCWGMCGGSNSTTPMPNNNGNLKAQQVLIPQVDNSTYEQHYDEFTEFFEYDSFNRLQFSNQGNWRQWYTYDQYGNRTINPSLTYGGVNNLAFDTNEAYLTNRIYAPGDTPLPMTQRQMQYDAAGNLTKDTYTGHGNRSYDAENRMTASAGISPAVYFYDGDGRRVKRIVGSTETWQVYGIGGELIAEYAANSSPATPQKEYGYRNGQLLVTATAGTPDWGPPPSYTPPFELVPGLEIKLEHLTELRTAVNQLRQHAGLPNFNFTVDPIPVRYETTVKADHIRQLRTALEQARTQLGLPIGGYVHPTLTENQSWIHAIDFQEIRNQIANAWNSGTGIVDIRWMLTDQLGTPRMIFDQSGSLATTSRHDYLPFGEELFAGTGGRTTAQGYSAGPYALDGARQKFTQKERDNETGLDYFLARYYSSSQGRFTSPDEFKGGPDELFVLGSGDEEKQALPYAEITNPQSLNKYTYVYNNPLSFLDPDGHQGIIDSIQRYWQALGKRFNDQLHPEQAAEEARPRSPSNPNWGAVVEGHAQAMGQAAEIAWNAASVADITGAGSVFHGVATNNKTEAAMGLTALLPLSKIFRVGKGAVTSGELLVGQVGKVEVMAQFSKEGDTLVAGIAALYNRSKGLARESAAKQLFESVAAFAKEQGLSKVEVQAIAVRNPAIERKLIKDGFRRTTVRSLGQEVSAYTKTFDIK